MKNIKKQFIGLLLLGMLTSCATRTTPAPIINATNAQNDTQSNVSTPNNTNNSDTSLGTVDNEKVQTEATKPTPVPVQPQDQAKPVVTPPVTTGNNWIAPTNGAVTNKFTPASKGIDYTGKVGQNVNAVNDGKVLYSGNGLKGYGNLIIIKHDAVYLSAYAHNQSNLVKVGDTVKRGQKIATMGTDNGKADLHLEIRQNGKPIDPLTLIK